MFWTLDGQWALPARGMSGGANSVRVGALILLSGLALTCDSEPPSPPPRQDSARVVDERGRITDLVCPGATGCESATGPLFAGVGRRSITPVVEPYADLDGDGRRSSDEPYTDLNGNGVWDPVWMAGFDIGRPATGVHDDVDVRALSVRKGDLRVGLVAIDCVGYFVEEVLDIRKVANARGLGFDHIVVAATHNHETKDTMGLWGSGPLSSGYDRPYMVHILTRAVEALAEARLGERETTVTAVQAELPELVADSREPIVLDPTVTHLAFADADARVFASLVVFGNHPEALSAGNTLITSDYPHYLREALQAHWPGSTAVFFAGSLGGLMNPLGVRGCPDENGEPQCRNGEFRKARYIGEGVARAIIEAHDDPAAHRRDEAHPLTLRRKSFLLGTTNLVFALGFSLGAVRRDVFDPEGRKMNRERVNDLSLDEVRAGALLVQTEVNHITLGPVDILTVPGELYPELWLAKPDGEPYLEAPENADYPDAPFETPLSLEMPASPRPKIIINQANDALGYIIPKRQFDELPPFAYRPGGQYGEQNSLGPDTAPKLNEAVRALYRLEP